jgi:hypothetical protein
MKLSLRTLLLTLVGPRQAQAATRPNRTPRLHLEALEERATPSAFSPTPVGAATPVGTLTALIVHDQYTLH